MSVSRRKFMQGISAGALTAASMSGVGTALSSFSARAADSAGYKALVCVFLGGGMDNYDTIIPYDRPSYDRWAQIRQTLLPRYAQSRARSNLLPLGPRDAERFAGREFALPAELSGIGSLFERGNAAIVGNVGPLIQAVDRASFEAQTVRVPPRLFSHNDQQSVWLASSPEGAQFGWGGLFADAASAGNSAPEFTSMTTGEFALFGTGRLVNPYQFGGDGAPSIEVLEEFEDNPLFERIREHVRGRFAARSNLLERDIAAKLRDTYDSNVRFGEATGRAPTIGTAFPESEL
ncbi:MAG: hypothetical protein AAFQ82_21970, partial [Myxococcota bacterium]